MYLLHTTAGKTRLLHTAPAANGAELRAVTSLADPDLARSLAQALGTCELAGSARVFTHARATVSAVLTGQPPAILQAVDQELTDLAVRKDLTDEGRCDVCGYEMTDAFCLTLFVAQDLNTIQQVVTNLLNLFGTDELLDARDGLTRMYMPRPGLTVLGKATLAQPEPPPGAVAVTGHHTCLGVAVQETLGECDDPDCVLYLEHEGLCATEPTARAVPALQTMIERCYECDAPLSGKARDAGCCVRCQ